MARWMAGSKKLERGGALEIRRANLAHIGDIMAEHVLDAHLERGSRAGTSLAGTSHLQCDDAVVKSLKHDIAAIHGNGRTNPGVEELLDLANDVVILLTVILVSLSLIHI